MSGNQNQYEIAAECERFRARVQELESALAQAHAEKSGLRKALLAAIVPLEALMLSHGDQFGPEMVTAIQTARRLTLLAANDASKAGGEGCRCEQIHSGGGHDYDCPIQIAFEKGGES